MKIDNTQKQQIKRLALYNGAMAVWAAAEKIGKKRPSLTSEEVAQINTVIKDIYENSGLKEKGIKLVTETADTPEKTGIIKKFLNKQMHNPKEIFTGGNEIHYIKDSPLIGFHEMGHAMDFAFGNIRKKVVYVSGFAKLFTPLLAAAGGIIAIAAVLNKAHKNKQGKTEDEKGSVINKIQKHYGKAIGAIGATVLIPEISASARGLKMASQHLPKNIVKKVNRAQLPGLVTYAMFALSAGFLADFLANTDSSLPIIKNLKSKTKELDKTC